MPSRLAFVVLPLGAYEFNDIELSFETGEHPVLKLTLDVREPLTDLGEILLEPAYSMYATPRLPEGGGPYRIRGIGSDGRTLLSVDFTPGEDAYGDRHFFFTVPIEPEWENSLERVILTGPEGLVALDQEDGRTITVVTERGTGRIRAILRDWEGVLPAVLRDAADLEVRTTRGVAEAVRLRR